MFKFYYLIGSEVMGVPFFLNDYNIYSTESEPLDKPVAIMLRITWSISLGYELNNLSLLINQTKQSFASTYQKEWQR